MIFETEPISNIYYKMKYKNRPGTPCAVQSVECLLIVLRIDSDYLKCLSQRLVIIQASMTVVYW